MAKQGGLKAEKKKRVVILNKYGARHPSITGSSSRDMADFLSEKGLDVVVVSIHAPYKGQIGNREVQLPYRTIELPSLYNGNNKLLRLAGNLIDGLRLILRSMVLPRHDVKIVMTDPSLINAWAILFRPFYRSKLAFWTMDLYPDAFVAAGLVSKNNPIYRVLSSLVYGHVPDFLIALGEQQYRYLCRQYKKEFIPHIVLPCGIYENKPADAPAWRTKHTGKIVFCYAGNIGEAHNAGFLVELINHLDRDKHVMVLCLYGAKASWVWDRIDNKGVVERVDFVSRGELQYVDINIASLLPAWNHVCVPSKVVSAICAGTPVLYNANEESEGACMFPGAVWLIPDSEAISDALSRFLKGLTTDTIRQKRQAAQLYACRLRERDNNNHLLMIIG